MEQPLKSIRGGRREKSEEIATAIYGKVMPQAVDLEEAILGGIMLERDAFTTVLDILRPESFYRPEHRIIYKICMQLFEKSQPIDLLTVTEALRKAGKLEEVGGAAYLVSLTNKVGSAAHIEHYARIVAQKYIQRELIRVSTRIIEDAFEDRKDVFDLLDEAEQGLYEITDKNLRRGYMHISDLVVRAKEKLETIANAKDELTGVPSGFEELDRLTNGWQKSDLIIVAARPGMGKTSFTLSLALNSAVEYRRPVAFFSLEMSALQVAQRLISMQAEIEGSKLRNGQLEDFEWAQLHRAIEQLSEAPLFVDDTPALNIFELRAKCRRLKQHHKIELVIVDYLQLMTATVKDKNFNREQVISTISRALKGLAKELDIPVIALAQLSRQVETRSTVDRRPQLSDLRESGAIEQDADLVLFLYRPEYYKLEDDEMPPGYTELIIAKHRNGPLRTIPIKFQEQYTKFVSLEEDPLLSLSSKINEGERTDDPFGGFDPEDMVFPTD